jgi:hypothetical protein
MKLRLPSLLLLILFCCTKGVGQSSSNESPYKELSSGRSAKVKIARTFTSEPGVFKMRPFMLTQVLSFDEHERLISEKTFTYSETVFGVDTSMVMQELFYKEGKHQLSFMKKTFIRVENKERHKKEIGYDYTPDGKVARVLIYQPDGTIQEGETEEEAILANLKQVRGQSVGSALDNKNIRPNSINRSDWVYRERSNRGPARRLVVDQATPMATTIQHESIANGYITREVSSTGKVVSEQRVLLNEKKQVSHVITSHHDLKGKAETVSITNHVYDVAGREIEQTVLDKAGKLNVKYAHTYDDQGLLIESYWTGRNGKVLKKMRYAYEFF